MAILQQLQSGADNLDMGESASLREVMYERYEYTSACVGDENTVHTGTLLTFVYDIPHFGACGVLPPLHIANQIFSTGKVGAGMSPGTVWKPFTVSPDEYAALVGAIQRTPISEIKPHARYAFVPMKVDHSFDEIAEWLEWVRAVCKKHRETWHNELRRAGAMS